MLNIEKYKDNILNTHHADLSCCVNSEILKLDCFKHCSECKKHAMEWLLEEYKEPVLDDTERKYLSEVIRPFKNYVTGITKIKNEIGKGKQYIRIIVNKCMPEYINMPYFEENTMYKGMEANKEYSLEELDL